MTTNVQRNLSQFNFIIFTNHANQRLLDRNIHKFDVFEMLELVAEELREHVINISLDPLESTLYIAVVCNKRSISLLLNLNINKETNTLHITVITIMNFVPRDQNGKYRFYDVNKVFKI